MYIIVCLFLINKHINQLHNDDSCYTKLLKSIRPRISYGVPNKREVLDITFCMYCYLFPNKGVMNGKFPQTNKHEALLLGTLKY